MATTRMIVPVALAAAVAWAGAAQADSYETVNPDGSVTRTEVTPQGETKSMTLISPPTRQTQAEIIQRMAEAAPFSGIAAQPREFMGSSAAASRGRDNDRDQKFRPRYYPYLYPLPGNYYSYPAYPWSYQLPSPTGNGPWITSIPGNNGYVYPGWGYPTNPGYPVNQGYPYNYTYQYPNGYPVGGFPGYPTAPYPGQIHSYTWPYGYGMYGSGSYSTRSNSTYGGVTIGRGGVGVKLGGGTTTTEHTHSTR